MPHYWHYALVFILKCKRVIKQLDDHGLLANYVGYHVTGHSLGGALANLVSANNAICQPVSIRAHLPAMPSIVSFNAPGIGAMEGIDKDPYNEGMVMSMRAEYDLVSALGEGYGYVINNVVPEGCDSAKQAFNIEQGIESSSLKQMLCDQSVICQSAERADQLTQAESFLKQHSMANFVKLIAEQSRSLAYSFDEMRSWAIQNGGTNHDLNAAPMFGHEALVKAA